MPGLLGPRLNRPIAPLKDFRFSNQRVSLTTCQLSSSAGKNPFSGLKSSLNVPPADAEERTELEDTRRETSSSRGKGGASNLQNEGSIGGFELKLVSGSPSLKRSGGSSSSAGQHAKTEVSRRSSTSGGALRVYSTRRGRGGKTVTIIEGLPGAHADYGDLPGLLKAMKAALGTGGTVRDGTIEMQGDVVQRVSDQLVKKGFKVQGRK